MAAKKSSLTESEMIQEILTKAKAGGAYIGGDLVFSLAFRTAAQLRAICADMGIKTGA